VNGSPRRVVGFLLSLWKISPVLTSMMFVSQGLFAVLTSTIAPLFVSKLLFHIANGSATISTTIGLLIGYAIILFLGDVLMVRISIGLAFITERRMQISVDQRVFDHMTRKSLTYHSNRMSGGLVSDKTKLFGSIERFWDVLIFSVVPIVLTITSVCIALIFIFWQFAIILAVLSVVIGFAISRAQLKIAPLSRAVSEKGSKTTAYFADTVSNVSSVKAFAGEESESRAYAGLLKDWRKASIREMKGVLLMTGSFSVLMAILNSLAFLTAIIATQTHLASIGVVYLVINYTLNIVAQLWNISSITRGYNRIIGDAAPMIQALDEPIDLTDPRDAKKLVIGKGAITFSHVDFTHSENSEALFNDFSLTIKAGEKVGLVGESGSGKTSLTRLLLRFSDVDGGEISIDGQSIADVSQADLHRSIAYVAQEPALFHRSLKENIAYGNPGATLEQVKQAAELAHATEFIDDLPQGYDTLVGERGIKLSGGQRQRVAIARAILKNAPILVLDEATSALDSRSEKLIQDALTELMKGRTSIVIAHRLSTIAKLDRIIVMDHGQIIEDGTHQELLKNKNGMYASLWKHQSGGFLEED
jgi:ATP-binding cassette, subfamily B, bacterial